MILSERELELSTEHDGILVLGEGYAPGEPLALRLPLSDEVLELEISSNRSDLLSVRGVARDVAAAFGLELLPLDEHEPAANGDRLDRRAGCASRPTTSTSARASARACSRTCGSGPRRCG